MAENVDGIEFAGCFSRFSCASLQMHNDPRHFIKFSEGDTIKLSNG